MTQPDNKTINIAIDGNEANVAQPVGSNVYAQKVLIHLEKITRQLISTPAGPVSVSVTVLLASKPTRALPRSREGWNYQVIGPNRFWTQFALPLHLFQHRAEFNAFFTPGHYAPRLCPIPYISSVMDVAYLEYPDQFKKSDLIQLKEWTAYSVKNATKVLAISQATQKDIVKYYHRSNRDIITAYPALPNSIPSAKKILSPTELHHRFKISTPYLLYVGTFQPRKNLEKLIEAFEQLKRMQASSSVTRVGNKRSTIRQRRGSDQQLQLVLAGKTGWLAQPILDRVAASPFIGDIKLPGYVTELEKISLLSHASASVLVGLKEGFGIPPLESMAVGTIPVVSKTSSLPEVVGNAGIQVDPNSVKSIANGLYKALQLTAKGRAQYQSQMRRQLKKFDWSESAFKILQAIIEVSQ